MATLQLAQEGPSRPITGMAPRTAHGLSLGCRGQDGACQGCLAPMAGRVESGRGRCWAGVSGCPKEAWKAGGCNWGAGELLSSLMGKAVLVLGSVLSEGTAVHQLLPREQEPVLSETRC